MNRIIALILINFLITSVSKADVYVITAPDNSVYSLSEADDAVLPQGYVKTIVKGSIKNLPISGDSSLYNFNNGAFSINTNKIQEKQAQEKALIAEQTETENNRKSGLGKLKTLGLTDDEIKALIK